MKKIYYYLSKKFYDWNYACSCGCCDVDEVTMDKIDYLVCEYKEICINCGREVGYWAYGSYTYPRSKTEELQYRWLYYKQRLKSKFGLN
ncbi:MAG: hypothetical protein A2Y34_04480 [Spirochaetes bacterium GWC1_27_15]|nr:MAG: hypothetical protein A2Y34_04480 [Spirochaetes bacterium GWC1_27_15]